MKQDTSDSKFVALVQGKTTAGGWVYGRKSLEGLLIDKVHKKSWNISIGFEEPCDELPTDQHKHQVGASVSKAIRLWLSPLSDKKDIVADFKYHFTRVSCDPNKPDESRCIFDNVATDLDDGSKYVLDNVTDLDIVFRCGDKRSRAYVTSSPVQIVMLRENIELFVEDKEISDFKKYSLSTLVHELGHAFGLRDTYIETEYKDKVSIYNESDDNVKGIAGTQPISVMNVVLMATSSKSKLQLGTDDEEGIKWLYRYHVEETVKLNECPSEYRYEKSTGGCTPCYPVIFAVKQGHIMSYMRDAVVQMLAGDVDVNAQDFMGNTALHYAALSSPIHGKDTYNLLVEKGADKNIKNSFGDTPQDFLDNSCDLGASACEGSEGYYGARAGIDLPCSVNGCCASGLKCVKVGTAGSDKRCCSIRGRNENESCSRYGCPCGTAAGYGQLTCTEGPDDTDICQVTNFSLSPRDFPQQSLYCLSNRLTQDMINVINACAKDSDLKNLEYRNGSTGKQKCETLAEIFKPKNYWLSSTPNIKIEVKVNGVDRKSNVSFRCRDALRKVLKAYFDNIVLNLPAHVQFYINNTDEVPYSMGGSAFDTSFNAVGMCDGNFGDSSVTRLCDPYSYPYLPVPVTVY